MEGARVEESVRGCWVQLQSPMRWFKAVSHWCGRAIITISIKGVGRWVRYWVRRLVMERAKVDEAVGCALGKFSGLGQHRCWYERCTGLVVGRVSVRDRRKFRDLPGRDERCKSEIEQG